MSKCTAVVFFLSHSVFSWNECRAFHEMWSTIICIKASLSTLSLAKSRLSGTLSKVPVFVFHLQGKGGLTCKCQPWSTPRAAGLHYLPHLSLLDSVAATPFGIRYLLQDTSVLSSCPNHPSPGLLCMTGFC